MMVRGLAIAGLAAASACHVFDPPPLAGSADGGSDPAGDVDAGSVEPVADAAPTDDPESGLSDRCTDPEMPLALSDDAPMRVNLGGLQDDLSSFPTCGASELLDGADGFISIVASAGERWHIEAEPRSDFDVALYVLPSCDALTCDTLVDRCGPGLGERFSFRPRAAGEYLLGIDGRGAAGDVDLYVVRSQCGNGVVERGEACDDGNLDDRDGCDSDCRAELSSGEREQEPNDRAETANAIVGGRRPTRLAGSLGGPCDADSFVVDVPEGGAITAVLGTGAGGACADDHPVVELALVDLATGLVRGFGTSGRDGGACPSLERGDGINEDLPAGRYQLLLTTASGIAPFDYLLQVRIRPTGGRRPQR
jgi:cysteine-rich repeat protein